MSIEIIGTRITSERKAAGLTQEQLAESLDVTYATVGNWERGARPMPIDKLESMKKIGLDIAYIVTGKKTGDATGFKNHNANKSNDIEKSINPKSGSVATFPTPDGADKNLAYIPLYNTVVSAGSGAFSDCENIITRLAFNKYSLRKQGLDLHHLACVQVTGDSMQPTLNEKDTVLIDMTATTPDGAIYALRVGDAYYIKRLVREPHRIAAISDNKMLYDQWSLKPEDDFEIIGKVVWYGRYV